MFRTVKQITTFALSFLIIGVIGCANTQMQSTWRDPTYAFPQMKSILVMGITPNETGKRSTEDAFVKDLARFGVRGTPSYSLAPGQGKLDQAGWERLISEHQIQGLLIIRLTDKKTVEREVPPTTAVIPTGNSYNYAPGNTANPGFIPAAGTYNNNWYGYYSNSYSVVTQPGYTVKEEYAIVETKLYDTANKKLVWTGTSHTAIGGTTDALIRDFARVVSDAIYDSGK